MMNFSPACERNKVVILAQIKPLLTNIFQQQSSSKISLLELGSGTAQHAEYFCQQLPMVNWQCTDVEANMPLIRDRRLHPDNDDLSNFLVEKPLDFSWPVPHKHISLSSYQVAYTSNTFHILSWSMCLQLIKSVSQCLQPNATVIIYGPFKFDGKFTSKSNQAFDEVLKSSNPVSGIRNIEDVISEFSQYHFSLSDNLSMPANNQLLIFTRNH